MLIWGSNLNPLIRNNYFHHNLGHGTIDIGSWSGSNTSPVLINNIITDNISNGVGTDTGLFILVTVTEPLFL
jgi:polygalacturonase